MNNNASTGKRHKNNSVPPTVKKGPNPTDRPPLISIGKWERAILKVLSSTAAERFNVRRFALQNNVARSTVNGALSTLEKKGLIIRPHLGIRKVTEAGSRLLEDRNLIRTVGRGAPTEPEPPAMVRDHRFAFQVSLQKGGYPPGWSKGMVAVVTDREIQTSLQQFSKNNPLLRISFDEDVKVTITTTGAIIRPRNIYKQDDREAAEEAITKTLRAIDALEAVGFRFHDPATGRLDLRQTDGHYARVNSVLADFFERFQHGFQVRAEDGKTRFWIDHSDGHKEDETASEEDRVNVQNALTWIMDHPEGLPRLEEDVRLLKGVCAELTKQSYAMLQMHRAAVPETPQPLPPLKGKEGYFG